MNIQILATCDSTWQSRKILIKKSESAVWNGIPTRFDSAVGCLSTELQITRWREFLRITCSVSKLTYIDSF